MSNREERWRAAAYLAQLVAENDAGDDALHLEQAFDDLVDGVEAARRNLADGLPGISAEQFAVLSNGPTPLRLVGAEEHSKRVPESNGGAA